MAGSIGVLFVCLGNICRSPTAEGVFRARADAQGLLSALHIDSAGTASYHAGEQPDRRSQRHALRRGYDLGELRARQVLPGDFDRFDYVLAADRSNLRDLERMKDRVTDPRAHLGLFLGFASELDTDEIPDPYYGGAAGFEHVLDLCEAASDALLEHIRTHHRR